MLKRTLAWPWVRLRAWGARRMRRLRGRARQEAGPRADGRALYRIATGDRLWLNPTIFLDRQILKTGAWEPRTTGLVRRWVRPGDTVLDVGANLGYFSLLLSRLVGAEGRVLCFEPSATWRRLLEEHVELNGLTNCAVLPYGLSDATRTLRLSVGAASATVHWVGDERPLATEEIEVRRLDDVAQELDLGRLDFIKVDVDGHEPAFLEGAQKTLLRFRPKLVLEVSHEHYLDAGVTAWEFYERVKTLGLHVYSEVSGREYKDRRAFLQECGNFTHSGNVLLSFDPLDRGAGDA